MRKERQVSPAAACYGPLPMRPDTRSFYESAVLRAVGEVVGSLDRALDLEALAAGAALSPFHFHRVFRGMLGETPLELHRRLRMERAAWRLIHGEESVTTVAFAAGYETHESFTRAFRACYGCAPSQFRDSRRAGQGCARTFQIELPSRSGIHFRSEPSPAPTPRFTRGEPAMHVEIEDMPELRVATVRHVGPYHRIQEAFARLGELAAAAGLFGPESAMIAIYHDDPETTPGPELQSDAALVVSARATLPDGLVEQRLPAGRYAHTRHVGPYARLGDTWSRFMGEWLPSSEHRIADGASYEIYRNTPGDTPQEELVTDLYLPLA
jgi:AraC family transcriptional regulator